MSGGYQVDSVWHYGYPQGKIRASTGKNAQKRGYPQFGQPLNTK